MSFKFGFLAILLTITINTIYADNYFNFYYFGPNNEQKSNPEVTEMMSQNEITSPVKGMLKIIN